MPTYMYFIQMFVAVIIVWLQLQGGYNKLGTVSSHNTQCLKIQGHQKYRQSGKARGTTSIACILTKGDWVHVPPESFWKSVWGYIYSILSEKAHILQWSKEHSITCWTRATTICTYNFDNQEIVPNNSLKSWFPIPNFVFQVWRKSL